MAALHLLVTLALGADTQSFDGVPLAHAEMIWQIEVRRMPPEALAPLCADPNPAVRRRAAIAAGRLRAPGRLLAGPSADPDVTVRRAVAEALGYGSDTVSIVRGRLRDEADREARTALLVALGRVGGPEDIPTLVAALQSPLDRVAAGALGRMGVRRVDGIGGPTVLQALLDVVEGPFLRLERTELRLGPEASQTAAWAISRTSFTALPPSLVSRLRTRALQAGDPRVRAWLVRGAAPVVADRAFLAAAARDDAPGVRLAAVRAMAKHGCDPPALAGMYADVDVGVRAEALGAAGTCEGAALDPLRDALTSGTAAERAAALRSLAARRELPAALTEFQGESWPLAVRIAAVEAMKERPALLRLALTHADPRLRSAAVGVLLGGDIPPRVAEITELLSTSDTVLVQAAAQAAMEHPDPILEAPLIGVLRRWGSDRASAASAIRALDALYATGRLPPPKPETRKAMVPWLGLPEVASAARRLATTAGIPLPRIVHPTRALPGLAEVARVKGARVATSEGELRIALLSTVAPLTVWNFVSLAEAGYFDGLTFHRVVPDFVVQTGDPRGDGWGGPGFEIPDELSSQTYSEGAVGMALSGPDTGGSQWFVTTASQPHLDFGYTVFGRLTAGLRVARAIDIEDRITGIVIERSR
ncbi:MAG: hypothetical protein EXR71_15465 [Myxococcales bacterium]|nr:hypothetical protein [Myxococcales bacterium]